MLTFKLLSFKILVGFVYIVAGNLKGAELSYYINLKVNQLFS